MSQICAGMKRFEARVKIIAELKTLGLYRGEEENAGMVLPICSRSKDVIEPMLKPQWCVGTRENMCDTESTVGMSNVTAWPSGHGRQWSRAICASFPKCTRRRGIDGWTVVGECL